MNFSSILIKLASKGYLPFISDKFYLQVKFKQTFGYKLNLSHPKTFNEKLQWLKLYDRRNEFTDMVDKYLVKEFVSNRIGKKYVIPTIGVWEDPDKIEFDDMPSRFVLKCTHNSGKGMYICHDKSSMDKSTVINSLKKGLKQNFYLTGREWPYKNVKRRIIAETYIGDGEKVLNDYKVLCFEGRAKLIELHQGRFTDSYTQDFYDIRWNKTDINQVGERGSAGLFPKPDCLEEIIVQSEKLARGIHHVRVDWYIYDNRPYFGEMTFFDASGFDAFQNVEYDLLLGSWIKL